MTRPNLPKLAILPITASVFLASILAAAQAQTVQQEVQPNWLKIDGVRGEETIMRSRSVPGIGKVFLPGDSVSRAFPGDMFTPGQNHALEAQGIKTLGDFIAADAAVIGRVLGKPPRAVSQLQQDIKSRLR